MNYVEDVSRVSTGVDALDAALQGGVPKGSWVAVTGEPGTGKSILCMHYAWAGLKEGDPVIYVTTEAEFRDVVRQARQFRMYFDDYEMHYLGGKPPFRKPQIVVIDIFSLLKTAKQLSADIDEVERSRKYAALEIDVLIATIREAYRVLGLLEGGRKSPSKHVRLIIDSMSAFWADKPAMARRFSYQLKIATHRENVTAFLVSQYAMTTKGTFGYGLEHIADGVIHLWMDNVEVAKEVRRYLIIKKMRMTNHYEGAFRVIISPGEGILMKPVSGAAAGI
ncbi:MAG: KaiC domain-containing protein [Desulfurococcales archaeon]|nr:KaiC domain-containing protein [Desulfurococcales archaeon]